MIFWTSCGARPIPKFSLRKPLISAGLVASVVFGALAFSGVYASAADWAEAPMQRLIIAGAGDRQMKLYKISSSDLDQRGKDLRAALEKAYREVLASGKMSGFETDVTASVLPYVAAGMSFDDAEAILRAAGFSIGAHPDPGQAANPNRTRDWYAVLAKLSPFVEHFLSMTKVDAYVTLLPKSPGDYTTVQDVRASFFVSAP